MLNAIMVFVLGDLSWDLQIDTLWLLVAIFIIVAVVAAYFLVAYVFQKRLAAEIKKERIRLSSNNLSQLITILENTPSDFFLEVLREARDGGTEINYQALAQRRHDSKFGTDRHFDRGFDLLEVSDSEDSAPAVRAIASGLDAIFRKLGPPPEGSIKDVKHPVRGDGGRT
ncbi:hypothetical protein [Herbidospora daliensis]|uniref:hypothetical protein n=1 Tax=Herbidospora daliensis TaxID=295585 RepID=UPI0012FC5EF5|nr:hypothetical protein [Herbidospora daliensis]